LLLRRYFVNERQTCVRRKGIPKWSESCQRQHQASQTPQNPQRRPFDRFARNVTIAYSRLPDPALAARFRYDAIGQGRKQRYHRAVGASLAGWANICRVPNRCKPPLVTLRLPTPYRFCRPRSGVARGLPSRTSPVRETAVLDAAHNCAAISEPWKRCLDASKIRDDRLRLGGHHDEIAM
jgi:hypothetical protein